MKRSLSILMAILLLIAMSAPVYAAQGQAETMPQERGAVTPRYVAINSIWAGYSIDNGTAYGSAAVSQSGARANVKVILQRSTNGGSTYSDFATLSDKSYTSRSITAEGSRSGLDTSYKFRTKVVVTVYDSAGSQIDSGTAYS